MTKRIVIVISAIVVLVFANPTAAQEPGKVYRIGYLAPGAGVLRGVRQSLRELGYVEGKNLAFEYLQAKRSEQYPRFAKELVRLKVDLILAVGIMATRAAKQATRTIPIVMGNSSTDPVRAGLIDSLARPGGNITGVIDLLPDLAGKRLEILKEIFPKLSRVAHLSSASSPSGAAHMKATETAARALGVRVQALGVRGPNDLERAFRAAAEGGAEALIVVGVSFFIPHRPRIVNLEAKYRLPTMHTHERWVPLGGLISYQADSSMRTRRAAQYVSKILKGAKPADLPVEQPTKFNLEINLKTAKALGITFPPSILLRADEVIE